MTFNIIYTPNSVNYLSFFVWSLLDNSPYKFRLVSNGCSFKERAILKKMSTLHPRLSYYCFPTYQMQIHGTILNQLYAMCQDDYFCFMDSDIFATNPLPNFKSIMEKEKLTGLFAAMPLWTIKAEHIFKMNFGRMLGVFNQTEKGICIGGTYFSIYKKTDLDQIIQHYGVSFEHCNSHQLPQSLLNILSAMGYNQIRFDTGKIINLLLDKHKYSLKNKCIPEVCHIGGISLHIEDTAYQMLRSHSFGRLLKIPLLKPIIERYRLQRKKMAIFNKFKRFPKEEFQIFFNQKFLRRERIRMHFFDLYQALSKRDVIPSLPKFEEEEINTKLEKGQRDYIKMFNTHKKTDYNC